MRDLEERLELIADSVQLPLTTPEDDLARGRARRRRRDLGALGAAAVTAAVLGTSAVLLSGGSGHRGAGADFAGQPTTPAQEIRAQDDQREVATRKEAEDSRAAAERSRRAALDSIARLRSPQVRAILSGYRDILREDLDPTGAHIQLGPISNEQGADDALGTKLSWNGGGMLQVAVGGSLEGVQFFCDGACAEQSVAGATKALVITSPTMISVAVFQDDGDIVALTADRSFGNNGTSTRSLGLTVDQLLAAAADPRLDLPALPGQVSGPVGTQ